MNKNNLSLKFRVQVMTYKLSRNLKDLKHKIKYSRYNLYNFVHKFIQYLEFKGIINKNKYNQANNNNDIEYIKNVMESIISKYE